MEVIKGLDGRYYKPCSECGKLQSYLRKNYAIESLRLGKTCKSCSNKKTENCHRGWYRGIRISWYNKFKIGAETRGLGWELTLDDLADQLEKQKGRCALTGLDVEFPEVGTPQKAPASIDRINSSKDYTKDNIQIVLRKINMMKQSYSQEEFIDLCKAVATCKSGELW